MNAWYSSLASFMVISHVCCIHTVSVALKRLLTQEEAAERFEDEDKNGDGKVTWDEHVSEAFGSPQKISDSDSEDNDLRVCDLLLPFLPLKAAVDRPLLMQPLQY